MRVFKFRDLAQFMRFKRLWLVSGASDRARMSQHVNTVFASKSKKNVLFLARKTHDAEAEAPGKGDVRAPWYEHRQVPG